MKKERAECLGWKVSVDGDQATGSKKETHAGRVTREMSIVIRNRGQSLGRLLADIECFEAGKLMASDVKELIRAIRDCHLFAKSVASQQKFVGDDATAIYASRLCQQIVRVTSQTEGHLAQFRVPVDEASDQAQEASS